MPPKDNPYRQRLTRFLLKYDRANLSKIDTLLEKFAGEEDELMTRMVAKYGPEPPPPGAKPSTAASVTQQPPSSPTKLVVPGTNSSSSKKPPAGNAEEGSNGRPNNVSTTPGATHRQRVVAMYERYMPSKLDAVNDMMERYKGSEDTLIEALVDKYGPEPPVLPPVLGGVATPPPPPLPGVPSSVIPASVPASLSAASAPTAAVVPPPASTSSAPTPIPSPPGAATESEEQLRLRRRLTAFYSAYNPSEMQKIDSAMAFVSGPTSEETLFSKLCTKYNVSLAEFERVEKGEVSAPGPVPLPQSSSNIETSISGPQQQQQPSAAASDSSPTWVRPSDLQAAQKSNETPPPQLPAVAAALLPTHPSSERLRPVAVVPADSLPRDLAQIAMTATNTVIAPAIPPASNNMGLPPTKEISSVSMMDRKSNTPPAEPQVLPSRDRDRAPVPQQLPGGDDGSERPCDSTASVPVRMDPSVPSPTPATPAAALAAAPQVPSLHVEVVAGGEPVKGPTFSVEDQPSRAKRDRIVKWLQEHAPQDVGNIDVLMTFTVTEEDLISQLRRRYGLPEPSSSSSATALNASPISSLRLSQSIHASPREQAPASLIETNSVVSDSPQVGGSAVVSLVEHHSLTSRNTALHSHDATGDWSRVDLLEQTVREMSVELRAAQHQLLLREEEMIQHRIRQVHHADPFDTSLPSNPHYRKEVASHMTMRESVLIARENDLRERDRQINSKELALTHLVEQCSRREKDLNEKEQEIREREHAVTLLERAVRDREEAAQRQLEEARSVRRASNDAVEAYAADLEEKLRHANVRVRELTELCYPHNNSASPGSVLRRSPGIRGQYSARMNGSDTIQQQHQRSPPLNGGLSSQQSLFSPVVEPASSSPSLSPNNGSRPARVEHSPQVHAAFRNNETSSSSWQQLLDRDSALSDRSVELSHVQGNLARRVAEQQHYAGLAISRAGYSPAASALAGGALYSLGVGGGAEHTVPPPVAATAVAEGANGAGGTPVLHHYLPSSASLLIGGGQSPPSASLPARLSPRNMGRREAEIEVMLRRVKEREELLRAIAQQI